MQDFCHKNIFLAFLFLILFHGRASAETFKKFINESNLEVDKLYNPELGGSIPCALKTYQNRKDSKPLEQAYADLSTNISVYKKRRTGRSYTVNIPLGGLVYTSLDEGVLEVFKNAPDIIQQHREAEIRRREQDMRYGFSREKLRLFLPYIHTTVGSLAFLNELEDQVKRYKRYPEIEKRQKILYYSLLFINYSRLSHSKHPHHLRYKKYVQTLSRFLGKKSNQFQLLQTRENVKVVVQTIGILQNSLGGDTGVLSSELSEFMTTEKDLKKKMTYFIQPIEMDVNRELPDDEDIQILYEKPHKSAYKAEAICFSNRYTACLSEVGLDFVGPPQADTHGFLHIFATRENKLLHYVLDPTATEYEDAYDRSTALLLKVEEIGGYQPMKGSEFITGLWIDQGKFAIRDRLITILPSLGTRRRPMTAREMPRFADVFSKALEKEVSINRLGQLVSTPRFVMQSSEATGVRKKIKKKLSSTIARVLDEFLTYYSFLNFSQKTYEDLSILVHIARDFLDPVVRRRLFKFLDDKISFYLVSQYKRYPDRLIGHSDFQKGIDEATRVVKLYSEMKLHPLVFITKLKDFIDLYFCKKYPQVTLPLNKDLLKELASISKLYREYRFPFHGLLKNIRKEISSHLIFLEYSLPRLNDLQEIHNTLLAIGELENLKVTVSLDIEKLELYRSFQRLFYQWSQQKNEDESNSLVFNEFFTTYIQAFKRFDFKLEGSSKHHDLIVDILSHYRIVDRKRFSYFYMLYVEAVKEIIRSGLYSPEPGYEDHNLKSLFEQLKVHIKNEKIDFSPFAVILNQFIADKDYRSHSESKAAAFLCLAALDKNEKRDFLKLFPYLKTKKASQIDEIAKLLSQHKKLAKKILFEILKEAMGSHEDSKPHFTDLKNQNTELAYQVAKRLFYELSAFKRLEFELIKKNVSFIGDIIRDGIENRSSKEFVKYFIWINYSHTLSGEKYRDGTSYHQWSVIIVKKFKKWAEVAPVQDLIRLGSGDGVYLYKTRLMHELGLTSEHFNRGLEDEETLRRYKKVISANQGIAAKVLNQLQVK